ncbi:MAG: hypothetical protein HN736_18080 [Anaerolineae bacterium]|jgi:hypothetical protein|nr:hypothetical protein [Anaerolineae bacterium]MBT4309942.1 hypothetical protein [Anaerolineae bacterium]MBT4456816.1 hypothetical protein [Anaerolineae bacterium]MBT4842860.1 hypothetical protein [Anaerolineae bacterium]MBT6060884.1 hypothetical protein [Anaerolineae bacterium]
MHFSPALYLDPGSGSILIQLLVAALLGGGLFIRSQWAKILKMLGKDTQEVDEENNDDFEE